MECSLHPHLGKGLPCEIRWARFCKFKNEYTEGPAIQELICCEKEQKKSQIAENHILAGGPGLHEEWGERKKR